MPKKEKKVIKQKQKQTQKQVVNIKIGDVKRTGIRRKRNKNPIVKKTVQPVQYMYQATGSQPQLPSENTRAVYENIGVATTAKPNILGGANTENIDRPLPVVQVEPPLQIGRGAETRPSLFGSSNVEVDIEPLQYDPVLAFTSSLSPPSQSQTEQARSVRRAMQISEGRGADVPIEDLLLGRYNNEGQPPRRTPTVTQRQRLYEYGAPYKGDEEGVKVKSRKKKDT